MGAPSLYKDETDEGDAVYIETSSGRIYEIFITGVTESYTINVIGSPVEKGIVKFDHRVRNPPSILVEGHVTKDGYRALEKLYDVQNKDKIEDALVKFYGRGETVVDSLVVKNLKLRTTAQRLNMVDITLELQGFIMEGTR